MKSGSSISIWFFVGLSLVVNGALILGTGLYELINPPEYQVVLYQLHANIWWGALLFLGGIIYCFYFSPGRIASQQAFHGAGSEREDSHVQ